MLAGPQTLAARLRWSDPVTGEAVERIAPLPITIGRSPDNTILLNSNRVSRQHALIEAIENQIILTDRNSGNGTFVNRQRITRTALGEGDSIQIGVFSLSIEFGPAIQQLAAGQIGKAPQSPHTPRQVLIRIVDLKTGQASQVVAALPFTIGRQAGNAVVLADKDVSRQHATVSLEQGQLMLVDQGSANGTYLNRQKAHSSAVGPTDSIQIAHYQLALELSPEPAGQAGTPFPAQGAPSPAASVNEPTLLFTNNAGILAADVVPPSGISPGFPPAFFKQPVVSMQDLRRSGIAITETVYLTIGGGLGSFTWIDHLLISGAAGNQVMAIGLEPRPYARYQRLCEYSQIPPHERLRSNSDSCPDNIWGWPSYGLREIFRSLGHGHILNALRVGKEVFGEPVLTQTYTPRSSDVFRSIDREAQRINWGHIWRYGRAKAIRKTDDGRYVVAYTQANPNPEQRNQFIVAFFVHVAVGYPGVQFLADLQQYRESTNDFKLVVNAYEGHEHIYQHLLKQGGTVMVRGRGIVASRIIQRLYEIRAHNPNVRILHLMRSPVTSGHRYKLARRPVNNHWDFQPFNWPKASWGGTYQMDLEKADERLRDAMLNDWGGTTTADRRDWKRIVSRGLRQGWYQIGFGNVKRVERNQYGQLATLLQGIDARQQETWLTTDFIIDCTGLEATIDSNALLKDMVDMYHLERNPKGRLKVTGDFEAPGMLNGYGHFYASGAMTLGGPLAPVDSFLGLQFAAMRSVDALARLHAPGLRRLNGLRSFIQWTRWVRGVHP
ncbi:MAG TPA: FHA domain-containing protein [Ktedonobacterales bacterium]|nr:FHA domain-containing protein [Ktedonobacterales bacterium]